MRSGARGSSSPGPSPGRRGGRRKAAASARDPVLPVNLESGVPGGVVSMARQLLACLEGAQGVDLAPLRALAEEKK